MGEPASEQDWPEPWWRPWVTHRLMVPKWAITVALLAAVAWLQPAWALLLVPLGFVLWFPLEYVAHRYIFHFFVDHEHLSVASEKHVSHHLEPQDPDDLFVDPSRMLWLGIPLYGIYALVMFDLGQGLALFAGTYAALVYYEYMHLLAHAPNARPRLPWTKAMKRWHLLHHFKHEDHWYGVTTRAVDRVIGSDPDPDQVETSETVRTLGVSEANRAWMEEHT